MNKKEIEKKSKEIIMKYLLKGIEKEITKDQKRNLTLKATNTKEILNAEKVVEKSKSITYGVIKKYISYVNTEKLKEKEIKSITLTTEKQLQKNKKSIEKLLNNNNFSKDLYNTLIYASYKDKMKSIEEIEKDLNVIDIEGNNFIYNNEEDIKDRLKDNRKVYNKSRIVNTTKKGYKVNIDSNAIENFREYTNIIILSIYENINNVFVNLKGEIIFTRNTFKKICKPLKKEINYFYRDSKRKVEIDNTENTYLLDNQSFLDYKKVFTENKYKIDISKMLKDLKLTSKQLEIISYKIQGLSFENISNILNVSKSTIKTLFYRQNEKIREYLKINYEIAL